MEAAQGPSACGPGTAGLALGFSPPAGAVHGGLFFLEKTARRLLRARRRVVAGPLDLFWGFPRRQALFMVACFFWKKRHGGCSGPVSVWSRGR